MKTCLSAIKTCLCQAKRCYHVHEHVGMELLQKFGIPVPVFSVAATSSEAYESACDIVRRVGHPEMVVKAQVLAGGRAKGHWDNKKRGGVKMVSGADEVREVSSQMLGHVLYTPQTGERGRLCSKVMVCERLYPRRESYVAIAMDRGQQGPVLMASCRGGVNVEEATRANPQSLIAIPISIARGLSPDAASVLARSIGFTRESQVAQASNCILRLLELFTRTDATMVEVNPIIEDVNGRVTCIDCKLNLDSNASYRQQAAFALRDWSQEDARDAEAARHGFGFVGAGGSVGCLVNGAGLAMATMDIIQLHGGAPANFCDIGGAGTAEQVQHAVQLIARDEQVRAVLVNVFGGILRCDAVASGVVAAVRRLRRRLPLVLRLQGAGADEAAAIIAESGLQLHVCDGLDDAAAKAVHLVNSSMDAADGQVA